MLNETKGISRRNFLSGAALAGAALAGSAALAGCAPSTSSSEEEEASAASASTTTVGYDGTGAMPWLGEAPEIADADVEEELEADVVVVGLGCSGVPAARAAAEQGAKLVCLEASPKLNSVASDLAVLGGATQEKWGRGVPIHCP